MSEKPSKENTQKRNMSSFVRALSEPLSKYGWPSWLVYLLSGIGVVYLLNPTLGIIEFLPDNLPIIGNLDESVAVMMVLAGIVEALEGKKSGKIENEGEKETHKKIVKPNNQE